MQTEENNEREQNSPKNKRRKYGGEKEQTTIVGEKKNKWKRKNLREDGCKRVRTEICGRECRQKMRGGRKNGNLGRKGKDKRGKI